MIAGNNDHHLPTRAVPLLNVGKEKAKAAAAAVGGAAVVASFPPDDRGSDWNDLTQRQGHKPVAAAVRGALDRLQQAAVDQVELAPAATASERWAPQVRPRGSHL